MSAGWRLLVWDAPANDRQLYKMGLRPVKKHPSTLVGAYHANAKAQLLRHIDILKARGLRGKAVPAGAKLPLFSERRAKPSPAPAAPTVARSVAAQRRAPRGGPDAVGRRERKAGAPGRSRRRSPSPAGKSASATPLLGYTDPTPRLVKRSSLSALAVPLGASLKASR